MIFPAGRWHRKVLKNQGLSLQKNVQHTTNHRPVPLNSLVKRSLEDQASTLLNLTLHFLYPLLSFLSPSFIPSAASPKSTKNLPFPFRRKVRSPLSRRKGHSQVLGSSCRCIQFGISPHAWNHLLNLMSEKQTNLSSPTNTHTILSITFATGRSGS